MLRLRVRHRTELRYGGDAHDSINEVRMWPCSDGRQTVEHVAIHVKPHVDLHRHADAFGNQVAWFQVEEPHDRLLIEAEAVVSVAPRIDYSVGVAWAMLTDSALRSDLAEYLAPSELVQWGSALDAFVAELAEESADDVADWLRAMEQGVNTKIRYLPGITTVETTVDRVLEARCGVCQDMAHLFLALCRRRGVPARYVSGWLFEPGRNAPGESHAWCEAYVPGVGWQQFDPTHPNPDFDRYIRIGIGRDYIDVPPIRGSYVGAPTDRMIVTVQVEQMPTASESPGGQSAP